MTLSEAIDSAAWASPVAIVPNYLFAIVEKFPVQVIQNHRNVPPPPTGAGLAQGGYHHYEKRFSPEQFFCVPAATGF